MNRILIPVDFSNSTATLINYVKSNLLRPGTEICLLNVINEPTYISFEDIPITIPPNWLDEVKKAAEQKLTALKSELANAKIDVRTTSGAIQDTITECAKDFNANLIVVGSHSRNMVERFILGSVAEKLLRSSTVPVLVIPPKL